MELLTNKQIKSYQNSERSYIFKEKIEGKHATDNIYCKFMDHCQYPGEYKDAAHSICNFKYSVPEEILIVFHNQSNYGFHFIIKELAEHFEKQFNCLGQNTEKCIIFSVPLEEEVTKIDENGKEITRTMSCRLTAQDS